MKNFLLSFAAIIVVASIGYTKIYAVPCKSPIEYSIGTFDTKFGITREQFLADTQAGESLWEKAAGKELFDYNPSAKFKINLIYDERQRAVLQKQRTESGLEAAEETFRAADQKFTAMKAAYEAESAAYERKTEQFKKDQAAYESEVSYWNKRGGAKQSEYEKLEEERQRLNSTAKELNVLATSLNQQSEELNALLKVRNQAAQNYNTLVQTYNSKYASGLEFDQAEYRSGEKEINVYEFKTRGDLRFALAHELGHALGLDHVDNAQSVMYYMSGGQGQFVLSAEDLAELKNICGKK
jgi:predicted Zn-dependent protease